MAYSTIIKKIGECAQCSKKAPLTKSLCPNCYWLGIRMKSVAKQQEREIVSEPVKKEPKFTHNAELDRWFKARRGEMKGFCDNCGKPSCKNDDKYYKFSIAHILPKAYVKSVATHEKNWLELCFWGDSSCHTQMDNNMLDLTEMACWDKIVENFIAMYPFIDKKERRRIPEVLLQYINVDL